MVPLEDWRAAAYRLGRRWHRAGRAWPESPDALWTEIARACARATGREPREQIGSVADAWREGYDSVGARRGRRSRTSQPTTSVSVLVDALELDAIDRARGETPRSTWIREAALERAGR